LALLWRFLSLLPGCLLDREKPQLFCSIISRIRERTPDVGDSKRQNGLAVIRCGGPVAVFSPCPHPLQETRVRRLSHTTNRPASSPLNSIAEGPPPGRDHHLRRGVVSRASSCHFIALLSVHSWSTFVKVVQSRRQRLSTRSRVAPPRGFPASRKVHLFPINSSPSAYAYYIDSMEVPT